MRNKIKCGHLYTADDAGSFYTDAALVIEDGRITWVGENHMCPVTDDMDGYSLTDASACVALPGFVNAHGHSNLNGWRGFSDAADFTQWAKELSPHTADLGSDDIAHCNTLSVLEMLRTGTTCICDCTRYQAGQLADACVAFGMRCVAGGLANSPEYRGDGRPNFESIREDTLRYQRQYRQSPLAHFYLGAHSPYNCTEALLRESYEASKAFDGPFVIHAAETRSEVDTIVRRYGMRPIPWLDSLEVLSPRTLLIHCVQLEEEDIEIIRQRGCGVVHCPVSNAKLGNGIAPVRPLLDAGVTVSLGTDSMLSNNGLDMLGEMKSAALFSRLRGPGASLSCEEVVKMATIGGAKTLGLDGDIGSLTPGKYADLILLEVNHPFGYDKQRLLSDVVYYLGPQDIRSVYVGGQCVYEQGDYLLADAVQARREIDAYFKGKGKV